MSFYKTITKIEIVETFIVICNIITIINYHRKHEWFQKDLPVYLFPSPVDQDTSVVDPDAIHEVCEVRNYYINS